MGSRLYGLLLSNRIRVLTLNILVLVPFLMESFGEALALIHQLEPR
jgi:hypothetical protein